MWDEGCYDIDGNIPETPTQQCIPLLCWGRLGYQTPHFSTLDRPLDLCRQAVPEDEEFFAHTNHEMIHASASLQNHSTYEVLSSKKCSEYQQVTRMKDAETTSGDLDSFQKCKNESRFASNNCDAKYVLNHHSRKNGLSAKTNSTINKFHAKPTLQSQETKSNSKGSLFAYLRNYSTSNNITDETKQSCLSTKENTYMLPGSTKVSNGNDFENFCGMRGMESSDEVPSSNTDISADAVSGACNHLRECENKFETTSNNCGAKYVLDNCLPSETNYVVDDLEILDCQKPPKNSVGSLAVRLKECFDYPNSNGSMTDLNKHSSLPSIENVNNLSASTDKFAADYVGESCNTHSMESSNEVPSSENVSSRPWEQLFLKQEKRLIIENVPRAVDFKDIEAYLKTFGEIKQLECMVDGDGLVLTLNIVCDEEWFIECLNDSHAFGDFPSSLKVYKDSK